jgi:diguanylate cyclase (GGDEF)-like protein
VLSIANWRWFAMRHSLTERQLERTVENERAFNKILRLVASDEDFDTILEDSLDTLLSISWLSLLPKGGVMIADPARPDTLVLRFSKNLGPKINSLCAKVKFGQCLCGRAAQTREIAYASCVDDRHEIGYAGMENHGHYNVPILRGDRVLGVIVLYLPHGHQAQEDEITFLHNVADILAIVIDRKQLELGLASANEKLSVLASTDELTGLYNRHFLFERLQEEIDEARRSSDTLSVAMIDIDHFKRVNDVHGHCWGDEVLKVFSGELRKQLRRYDIAGRYGGEEFVVIFPRTAIEKAKLSADRIRKSIAKCSISVGDGVELTINVSLGIAELGTNESLDHLIQRVDDALYQAKVDGRNRVTVAESEVPASPALLAG